MLQARRDDNNRGGDEMIIRKTNKQWQAIYERVIEELAIAVANGQVERITILGFIKRLIEAKEPKKIK